MRVLLYNNPCTNGGNGGNGAAFQSKILEMGEKLKVETLTQKRKTSFMSRIAALLAALIALLVWVQSLVLYQQYPIRSSSS